eukprot:COSAG04_NODE_42_length_32379_cov_41.656691_19_plen_62_part_00
MLDRKILTDRCTTRAAGRVDLHAQRRSAPAVRGWRGFAPSVCPLRPLLTGAPAAQSGLPPP